MNYLNIFLFLFFLCIGGYLSYSFYNSYKSKENTTDFIENNEHETEKYKDGEVYLFYTTWCPHCKKTIELWNEMKEEQFGNDKMSLSYIGVNCDNDSTIADKYNVKEYPTIILVSNNKKFIFNANLNRETFSKFLVSVSKNT